MLWMNKIRGLLFYPIFECYCGRHIGNAFRTVESLKASLGTSVPAGRDCASCRGVIAWLKKYSGLQAVWVQNNSCKQIDDIYQELAE